MLVGDNDHNEFKMSSATEIRKDPFPCTVHRSSIVAAATLFMIAIAALFYIALQWA